MANVGGRTEEVAPKMEEGVPSTTSNTNTSPGACSSVTLKSLAQKVVAELMGTYFLIFAGCGALTVNKIYGSVTFPGVCVTWGLVVMALVYALGHVSGAHFNPAVTITLTLFRRLPLKEAPLYIIAQFVGAILASCTLLAIFDVTTKSYFGTVPAGSTVQAFVVEIIITFLLMLVISGVSTDDRAEDGFTGVAVGITIMLNVFVAGPVSGASMNPARSIAPAILLRHYKGLWAYIAGPIIGAIAAGFVYHLLRSKHNPLPPPNQTNASS